MVSFIPARMPYFGNVALVSWQENAWYTWHVNFILECLLILPLHKDSSVEFVMEYAALENFFFAGKCLVSITCTFHSTVLGGLIFKHVIVVYLCKRMLLFEMSFQFLGRKMLSIHTMSNMWLSYLNSWYSYL